MQTAHAASLKWGVEEHFKFWSRKKISDKMSWTDSDKINRACRAWRVIKCFISSSTLRHHIHIYYRCSIYWELTSKMSLILIKSLIKWWQIHLSWTLHAQTLNRFRRPFSISLYDIMASRLLLQKKQFPKFNCIFIAWLKNKAKKKSSALFLSVFSPQRCTTLPFNKLSADIVTSEA